MKATYVPNVEGYGTLVLGEGRYGLAIGTDGIIKVIKTENIPEQIRSSGVEFEMGAEDYSDLLDSAVKISWEKIRLTSALMGSPEHVQNAVLESILKNPSGS